MLNTRPAGQNGELSEALRKSGFAPVEIPLVAILPEEEGLIRLRRLPASGFTGVFLSSPNGLRLMEAGLDADLLARWMVKPFFLVGSKAVHLVERLGGKVAFVPEEASLQGFLKEYRGTTGPAGLPMSQRWLHPCSSSTRLDPAAFRARSVEVENLPVYKPGFPAEAGDALRQAGTPAAILFCSGSAADHFFQAAPAALSEALGKPKGILAVSIGASTSEALQARGVEIVHQAEHADNDGLLDALRHAYGGSETRVLKKGKA